MNTTDSRTSKPLGASGHWIRILAFGICVATIICVTLNFHFVRSEQYRRLRAQYLLETQCAKAESVIVCLDYVVNSNERFRYQLVGAEMKAFLNVMLDKTEPSGPETIAKYGGMFIYVLDASGNCLAFVDPMVGEHRDDFSYVALSWLHAMAISGKPVSASVADKLQVQTRSLPTTERAAKE